ncbi:ASPIC/UnbV domain protein [Acidobacteriia bacterium SbA2]|nr:ASPIC/UnbV domain protein [Acidobacteriia bacterium SbA2]
MIIMEKGSCGIARKASSLNLRKWTRRGVLRAIPAAFAPLILPGRLWSSSSAAPEKSLPPFSRFVDVALSAGLTHTTIYGDPHHNTYIVEVNGAGCAFFDYDNDGWMDVFILGGRTLEGAPAGAGNRLYHNNRDGTFTDVTEKSGLSDPGWACGVCVGDYDNDGFEDLYITYYGQNKLYRNNGDGTFTDVTAKAGLLEARRLFGSGCTFIDYNRDGWLDLFVSNYVEIDLANAPKPSLQVPNCNFEGVPTNCGPGGLGFPPHALYRNNGDGTFTDVSKESGIGQLRGSYGFTAVTFDADEDGWPDIFVACDATPSLLLLNNHDGTFREEAMLRGVAVSRDGNLMGGMGVAVGDYDLDGHLDILKTHFVNQPSGLYHNNGKADFEDVTMIAGLGGERRFSSWGAGLADLDNDGYPDIFIVAGTVAPELERVYAKYPARNPRLVFRNLRNGTFASVGDEAGPAIAARYVSRGAAFGDFDNDGDLDILIMNRNDPPSLLRNDAPSGNHWLKVRLEGTRSNRSAIGSRVRLRYGGKVQAQCVTSQSSFLSANDPRLHFGLGTAATADIEVHWPTGKSDTYPNVAANQLVTIREGQSTVTARPLK